MIKYVPVLGPEGWVSAGQKKLDQIMAHLYSSDASQSHLFPGLVSSMSAVVKETQGRLDEARTKIQEMLTIYFKNYFYNVEVIVYIHNTTDFHRGELVLAAEMEDETGQTFQLHEVMTKDGSVVRQFLDYQFEG